MIEPTNDQRQVLVREFEKLLNSESLLRVTVIRPSKLKLEKPGDQWVKYDPGPTTYWIIAMGDEQQSREDAVKQILEAPL